MDMTLTARRQQQTNQRERTPASARLPRSPLRVVRFLLVVLWLAACTTGGDTLTIGQVTQLGDTQNSQTPYVVWAMVTSPRPIARVRLYYARDSDAQFLVADMTPVQNGAWQAAIPPQAAGTAVRYYIWASDGASVATYPTDAGTQNNLHFQVLWPDGVPGGSGAADAGPDADDAHDTDAGADDAAVDMVGQADLLVTDAAGAAPDAQVDAVDGFATASHAPLPQLTFGGLGLLQHAHVVTVTFAGDTDAKHHQQFAEDLVKSDWWSSWSTGYCDTAMGGCVGQADATAVALNTAPAANYVDSLLPGVPSTLQDFIQAHVANQDFPTPIQDTLYLIYFPPEVSIAVVSAAGKPADESCVTFGAYHHFMSINGQKVAYAIVPQCPGQQPALAEFAAAHEIAEACTDPWFAAQTVNGVQAQVPGGYDINAGDASQVAWIFALGGGEVADLCFAQMLGLPAADAVEAGYTLPRIWSNAAAAAGADPCVPAPAGAYFNVAPELASAFIGLEIGASTTAQLHAYSQDKTPPWTLSWLDLGALSGNSTVTVTFGAQKTDTLLVQNGDVVTMHLSRDAAATTGYGSIVVLVSTSADGNVAHV